MIYVYIFISIAIFIVGFQIYLPELLLLTGRYNYTVQKAQFVTYIAFLMATCIFLYDICMGYFSSMLVESLFLLSFVFFAEFFLARLHPKRTIVSWGYRFIYIITYINIVIFLFEEACNPLFPFVLAGVYLRNVTFGIPHKKDMCFEYCFFRKNHQNFATQTLVDYKEPELPNFSYAGNNKEIIRDVRLFNVADYGILPNTDEDLITKVQNLIDMVGLEGGGKIFFPKGIYNFNKYGGQFLQINHSNIHIEGEIDSDGRLLTEMILCGTTVCGRKNPWLSPFFITTGEKLQSSNEFFGLQFRKRKMNFSQSNSLSDPGSDGTILTPKFCTRIVKSSQKGSCFLHVEDSSKVGKYIMLGMYNTSPDGNLIKDILGTEELRPEWKTALRAGEEEAPSYQWLVEVKCIVDRETVELVRPLMRDCDMVYEPAVFNVEMLENIVIRNLKLGSKWSGMFRHHGFPVYYSVRSSQEMDYGWNAINMKRVAYGEVSNVEIVDYTNPIYVLDSRNITVKDVVISGYDGHQGIKIYQHACDCLFQHITFYNHYADMLGGEGNAYGNVFSDIKYLNPAFNPVDFDFHGFGEGPMSPPSDNLFECIYGFRCIKSAGALFNLPSCAQNNIWWNIITEGERKGGVLFYAMTYREKKGIIRFITAVGFAVAMIQKKRNFSPMFFFGKIIEKLSDMDKIGIKSDRHYVFFKNSRVIGVKTTNNVDVLDNQIVNVSYIGKLCRPLSVYNVNK